jgi:threonine synthase
MRALWAMIDRKGGFNLAGTPHWDRVAASGFISGTSTHADRVATIRAAQARYGVVVDPHTADGIKVGLDHRDARVPLICVETALPAKFAATIREALGRDPARPAAYEGLEDRPQRCELMPIDVERVKAYIAAHAGAPD